MGNDVLMTKSFAFAVRIVRQFQFLQTVKKEDVLAKQLLRCGTSVGSMMRDAEHAESKADFIHKMAVAQKEINEVLYWLELLTSTDYLTREQFDSISTDAIEILKMLTSTIKTAKNNLKMN